MGVRSGLLPAAVVAMTMGVLAAPALATPRHRSTTGTQVTSLRRELAAARRTIGALRLSNTTLGARNAALRSLTSALKSKNANLTAANATLTTQNASPTSDNQNLLSENTTLTTAERNLSTEISSAQAAIGGSGSLWQDVTDLNTILGETTGTSAQRATGILDSVLSSGRSNVTSDIGTLDSTLVGAPAGNLQTDLGAAHAELVTNPGSSSGRVATA